jgi:hypothetical protein
MESIWGPVNGFYVAAYAAPAADGRYCSYAKVCCSLPPDYWQAQDCLFKLFGGDQHADPQAALLAVRRLAYGRIACIPPSARTMLELARREASPAILIPLTSAIRQVARSFVH